MADPRLSDFNAIEMDGQPTAKALHTVSGASVQDLGPRITRLTQSHYADRINADISQLLQRFENIMATATVDNPSYTATAVETYQLDVESTALIRAAEDILALTRTMKETWLFGKLDTLGEDDRDVQRREKLEKDVLAVQNAIEEGGLLKISPEK
ncbi:hypothetical protein N7448_006172 [Penicillium atrosanguineum]|uniref:Surfeit locus protein 5 subunit 22 of mediator complex-domain-containing protein n=1 Tax=Penicillium atrosanguineum TaxID=1132637 RepID=A0A9W9PRA4_9EURO|nr:uncharacterized protein N7443_009936 [Penicillium atrosanguineum]KAJ5132014.1 hypothetical protein N7448_006172 [Penicillium atrosanguineum]KAJ5137775.1 hypothetical protein N7526_004008 [Penicillium atrosanguineum]KAJ5289683.1 hypothetical protein N7443_009936 [Penicillium atrosanguineum]KAJ5307500.1 hypothetical protein N7476_008156 [Penicillium atrosanguineum]